MTDLVSYDPRSARGFGDPISETSTEVVDAVVRSAVAVAPAWAQTPGEQRARALEIVADRLDAAVDDLVRIADRETALGEARLRGEVARTTGQLRMFADLARRGDYVDPIISPADPALARPDVRRLLVAIGPVAVFGASNFPFAFSVAGGDTASALAAGCPVVVKAHEGHLATSRLVADLVARALASAGAPAGVFGIVFGPPAGRALVLHPGIKAVGFTGSTAGGRALFDLAVTRPDPIPFYGELGSTNPVVLLPGAAARRPDEIAAGYAGSLTQGVGQFCTNPGLLFLPRDEALVAAIGERIAAAAGGPMLTERVHTGYQTALMDPSWTGLEVVASGAADGPWAAAPEVRRVDLVAFAADVHSLGVERFGPAGLLVCYDTVEQLLPVLAGLDGSLTATIHAEPGELDVARRVSAVLARIAGRLIMNGWPTGVAVCWAMHHGGPWPATTSAAHTSVGGTAVRRWLVPIAYQSWPDELLPAALQAANPMGLRRTVQP